MFAESVQNSASDLVYLARGPETASGKSAWYYIRIQSRMKLALFLKQIKTGLTLTDYGTILYSGWGEEPPPYIKQKIQDQFGQ